MCAHAQSNGYTCVPIKFFKHSTIHSTKDKNRQPKLTVVTVRSVDYSVINNGTWQALKDVLEEGIDLSIGSALTDGIDKELDIAATRRQ